MRLLIAIAGLACVLATACADPELSAPVPMVPEFEEPDGSMKFRPPAIPDWVGTRTFEAYDITPQNRSEVYGVALDEHKAGDFAAAYPKFLATEAAGLKVANVYLGLIEGQAGELNYPRGSLTRHYEALDSGGHATSLAALARGLKDGLFIKADPVSAAQYYLRLVEVMPEDSALSVEGMTYYDGLTKAQQADIRARESAWLEANAGETPVDVSGDVQTLILAVIAASGTHKAPGTEYLAEYPR